MPPSHIKIETTSFSDRFKGEFNSYSDEFKEEIKTAIKLLKNNPSSTRLRLEKLKSHKNPSIYTIHVTSNHSHKISFELKGQNATLRRIATHKEIDRSP